MGATSRSTKKRKAEDDDDKRRRRSPSRSRSRSRSPRDKKNRREKEKKRSPTPEAGDGGEAATFGDCADSMSIEETNKLRAKLGLAPLEESTTTVAEAEDGSKVINEEGFEFRHKKAENMAEKKKEKDIKEKLEAAKQKRILLDRMSKVKGLADDDEDDDASNWIEKTRRLEEEKKRAAERAKALDDMDEEFGISNIVDKQAAKSKTKATAKLSAKADRSTGGLIVGHSKDTFAGIGDQILVLEDKDIMDTGDEVLVNPNMLDNERHARNVEHRKKTVNTREYQEDVDQFGNPIDRGVLGKYDEVLDGYQRETFRLDDGGGYDLDKEEMEKQMRHRLEMANKRLESLDTPALKVGSEFYTQEEMLSFRKPKKDKKGKIRKRNGGKLLKADDLVPEEPAGSNHGSRSRRRRDDDDEVDEKGAEPAAEDGEVKMEEADGSDTESGRKGFRKVEQSAINLDALRQLANMESDEDSDEEFGGVDLSGVALADDAEDELSSVLAKTRRLKQATVKEEVDGDAVGMEVYERMNAHGVKMEVEDEEEQDTRAKMRDGIMCIDATMEYCRNVGEIQTHGIAGNRIGTEVVDVSELGKAKEEEDALARWKESQRDKKKKKKDKGGWMDQSGPSSSRLDSDDEGALDEARDYKAESESEEDEDGEEDDDGEYVNVLGKEADVSKGVGAMLKLAAQKGYLADPNAKRASGVNLDHLKNKSKTQIEVGKYDIDDKYIKKLDRIGTTGRGPIQPFMEKRDYVPEVVLEYVDGNGREITQMDAYRELSYKFHGRKPGKKQTEKRMKQRDKKEKLKMMNSSDTPLGTLSKQLQKQEQLQTPYLVLSGSGKGDHTSLRKE